MSTLSYGEKPADAELVKLVDAYAKLDGSMDNLTNAMELMGQFCASCKKSRFVNKTKKATLLGSP